VERLTNALPPSAKFLYARYYTNAAPYALPAGEGIEVAIDCDPIHPRPKGGNVLHLWIMTQAYRDVSMRNYRTCGMSAVEADLLLSPANARIYSWGGGKVRDDILKAILVPATNAIPAAGFPR